MEVREARGPGRPAAATRADVVSAGTRQYLAGERIDSPHTHGTGCVLSAAIAAHLARGEELGPAVRLGKAFVTEAIRHAARLSETPARWIRPSMPLGAHPAAWPED